MMSRVEITHVFVIDDLIRDEEDDRYELDTPEREIEGSVKEDAEARLVVCQSGYNRN